MWRRSLARVSHTISPRSRPSLAPCLDHRPAPATTFRYVGRLGIVIGSILAAQYLKTHAADRRASQLALHTRNEGLE